MSSTTTIGDLLSRVAQQPLFATPHQTVREVAATMAARRVGLIMVRDDSGALVGVVSERDIVRAVADGDARFIDNPAIEIGTRGVVTCRPDSDPFDVYNEMSERKIRHMPVVEDGQVMGIVSITDLLNFFRDESSPASKAQILEALSSGLVLPGF